MQPACELVLVIVRPPPIIIGVPARIWHELLEVARVFSDTAVSRCGIVLVVLPDMGSVRNPPAQACHEPRLTAIAVTRGSAGLIPTACPTLPRHITPAQIIRMSCSIPITFVRLQTCPCAPDTTRPSTLAITSVPPVLTLQCRCKDPTSASSPSVGRSFVMRFEG
mmetsp:Transcript_873/g.2370  ORF Transcript_873/g.2370 Transcript_873/m.2370 type:complete len:165 (-) Transcript_873:1268-1762(-)